MWGLNNNTVEKQSGDAKHLNGISNFCFNLSLI